MLKRQGQSSKTINEQIQRKLAENGIHKDDLSKNFSVKIFEFFFVSKIFYFSYYVHENELLFHRLSLVNEVKEKILFYNHQY
jgi:hypothetical protein